MRCLQVAFESFLKAEVALLEHDDVGQAERSTVDVASNLVYISQDTPPSLLWIAIESRFVTKEYWA
jgi:hypothetical protein